MKQLNWAKILNQREMENGQNAGEQLVRPPCKYFINLEISLNAEDSMNQSCSEVNFLIILFPPSKSQMKIP